MDEFEWFVTALQRVVACTIWISWSSLNTLLDEGLTFRLHDLNATIIILAAYFWPWLISLDCFCVVRELKYSVMILSTDTIVLKLSNELFTRATKWKHKVQNCFTDQSKLGVVFSTCFTLYQRLCVPSGVQQRSEQVKKHYVSTRNSNPGRLGGSASAMAAVYGVTQCYKYRVTHEKPACILMKMKNNCKVFRDRIIYYFINSYYLIYV